MNEENPGSGHESRSGADAPSDPSAEHTDPPPPLEPEEESRAEIEAARERERQETTVELGASIGQRFIAALTGASVVVTVLAIVLALVIGALIIAISDDATREAMSYITGRPSDTFVNAWAVISGAYSAMFRGAFAGVGPISETLVASTPLILTGLAFTVTLRTGLFNIGAEGQMIAGGTMAGILGFSLVGLPSVIHLPVALLGGAIAGALYGWIPGILKARTGAHEVISTIMLNNIALLVLAWLLTLEFVQRPDRPDPISRQVQDSAMLPLFSPGLRVNAGLLVALLLAVAAFWLLERSSVGFELNAVGLNSSAATTAGMNPGRSIVTAFSTGGMLAGVAGAALILGVGGRLTDGFSAGMGFDGITVALLGRGGVGGTVAAGLLFGSMHSGGRLMQAETGIALDLDAVLQGLIIVFIAAPALVRAIFRIRAVGIGPGQSSKG